jgi:hypothetical protein
VKGRSAREHDVDLFVTVQLLGVLLDDDVADVLGDERVDPEGAHVEHVPDRAPEQLAVVDRQVDLVELDAPPA